MRTVSLPAAMDPTDFRLLNDWQRGLPIVPEPFAHIGKAVGLDQGAVIARYRALVQGGMVSRVGAVFAPRRLGASALAALAAPADRLEAVAARVSREAAINHNYQREHHFNLWFVVTAASEAHLQQVVHGIEADTGCAVIVLPMEHEFHIDLGFDLSANASEARTRCAPRGANLCAASWLPSAVERDLIAALQPGLPLVPAPFAALGERVGMSEETVLQHLERWQDEGLIRRFGVVVRHQELGLDANAMCVWDLPDDIVPAVGRRLAAEPEVTLCYSRRRALPQWPYNMFCMIHGSAREEVLAAREALAARLGLDSRPHAVLFSCRRFKQTGARYLPPAGSACHA